MPSMERSRETPGPAAARTLPGPGVMTRVQTTRSWAALLGGPLLAVAELAFCWSLVGPGCARRQGASLHGPLALGLTLCLLLALWAARRGSQTAMATTLPAREVDILIGDDGDVVLMSDLLLDASPATPAPRRLLPWLGTVTAGLAGLVVGVLWLLVALLPPCAA